MALSVEQLMTKRVIVENLWPECKFNVGDVLIEDGDFYWGTDGDARGDRIRKKDVEPFPYLMRPLNWWEERSPEDMPEYVKWWDITFYYPKNRVSKKDECPFVTDNFTATFFRPATEAEYFEYLKNK